MKTNRTYITVKTIAYAMFALGLGLSVTHIFELFHHTLHASLISSLAVPVFIDGFQVVGRLIRGEAFAKSTRRAGFVLQMFGASVSLAANVIAGPTTGDKIAGAIFVIGYITIEVIAEVMRPASDDAAAAARAAKAAAAAKAQATRAANRLAKQQAEEAKKEKARLARERGMLTHSVKQAEVDALNRQFAAESAPVSPAPIGNDAAYL